MFVLIRRKSWHVFGDSSLLLFSRLPSHYLASSASLYDWFPEPTSTAVVGSGPLAAVGVRLHECSEPFEMLTSFLTRGFWKRPSSRCEMWARLEVRWNWVQFSVVRDYEQGAIRLTSQVALHPHLAICSKVTVWTRGPAGSSVLRRVFIQCVFSFCWTPKKCCFDDKIYLEIYHNTAKITWPSSGPDPPQVLAQICQMNLTWRPLSIPVKNWFLARDSISSGPE